RNRIIEESLKERRRILKEVFPGQSDRAIQEALSGKTGHLIPSQQSAVETIKILDEAVNRLTNHITDGVETKQSYKEAANGQLELFRTETNDQAAYLKEQGFRSAQEATEAEHSLTNEETAKINEYHKKLFGDNTAALNHSLARIFINRETGEQALGQYYKGVIDIVAGKADRTNTYFHEAFHAYFNLFLTRQEKAAILTEISLRTNITDIRELEEIAANGFMAWTANKRQGISGKLKELFERLIQLFDRFIGQRDNMAQLYMNIWTGKRPQTKGTDILSLPTEAFRPAWQGSPHRDIEKEGFKNEAIGSGEGKQAFGWGHYFSGLRGIGEYYRKALTRTKAIRTRTWSSDEMTKYPILTTSRLSRGYVLEGLVKSSKKEFIEGQITMTDKNNKKSEQLLSELIDFVNNVEDKEIRSLKGQLYEVEIPKSEDFLQWDGTFIEQSEKVKEAINQMMQAEGTQEIAQQFIDGEIKDGGDFYEQLKFAALESFLEMETSENVEDNRAQAVSLELLHYGIKGNEYPAGTISGTETDARNFVVFDPELITDIKPHYREEKITEAEKALNDEYKKKIDKIEKGEKFYHKPLEVGRLPQLYRELISKDTYLTISQETIDKINNDKHFIKLADVKNILDYLDKPVAVFGTMTSDNPNALVVLTEIEEATTFEYEKGKPKEIKRPAVAILAPSKKDSSKFEIVKIVSVYGFDKGEVSEYFKNAERLFVDKEKALDIIRKYELHDIATATLTKGNIKGESNILNPQEKSNSKKFRSENAPASRELTTREVALRLDSDAETLARLDSVISDINSESAEMFDALKKGTTIGLRARTFAGAAGRVKAFLEDKTFTIDVNGNTVITGEGLKPILDEAAKFFNKPAETMVKDLNDYMIAQRIDDLDNNKVYVGDNFRAKYMSRLMEILGQYDRGHLDRFAQRVYAYQKRLLDLLKDNGLMSDSWHKKSLN
ncbi:MAG: hypothetical protein LBT79_08280, partial [Elusimicrobiota bacterium]|nr:hypothetical protein [Elusimicrobiota bacterium]